MHAHGQFKLGGLDKSWGKFHFSIVYLLVDNLFVFGQNLTLLCIQFRYVRLRQYDGWGWPKATPSTTVMLGVGLFWPQVVLWVPLATNGVMLWVLVTKRVVMPGVQQSACG